MKSDGSESVTVVVSNKSSSSSKRKKKVYHQQNPQGQTITMTTMTTPRAAPSRNSSSRKQQVTLCESPDAIKLRLPGSSPSPQTTTVTEEEQQPVSPPSLFRSPEKIWKILRCSSPSSKKGSKISSSRACATTDNKENCCCCCGPWMMMDQVQSCSCCCRGQSNNNHSFNNNKSGLTLDRLRQHESMIHETPDRTPQFEGDQLAKRVILQSKTNLQLAKERKEKAQQELDRVVVGRMEQDRGANANMTTTPFSVTDDMKTWIEMERQKALAAKWQRKKNEQWERVRAEQFREAELGRQRKLQTHALGKKKHEMSQRSTRDATPATPKTAHLKARKFIHI